MAALAHSQTKVGDNRKNKRYGRGLCQKTMRLTRISGGAAGSISQTICAGASPFMSDKTSKFVDRLPAREKTRYFLSFWGCRRCTQNLFFAGKALVQI